MTGGLPIGRQPLRAGQHRCQHYNVQNINYKQVNNYNIGQMMYPSGWGYGNYGGGYDDGFSKSEKWMLGLGIGTTILGAVLKAFGKKDVDGGGGEDPEVEGTEAAAPEAQAQPTLEQLQEENKGLKAQLADLNRTIEASRKQQGTPTTPADGAGGAEDEDAGGNNPVAGAQQQEPKKLTTSFNVQAKRNEDGSVTGHTGYNIVAHMYEGPDGKKLTHNEIMDICREVFKTSALSTGNIELPNEVTVNGKKYTINPNKKPEDVPKSTYNLNKKYSSVYKGEAKSVDGKWTPTIDGKEIAGAQLYDSKDEAVAAANKEIEKLKASTSEE